MKKILLLAICSGMIRFNAMEHSLRVITSDHKERELSQEHLRYFLTIKNRIAEQPIILKDIHSNSLDGLLKIISCCSQSAISESARQHPTHLFTRPRSCSFPIVKEKNHHDIPTAIEKLLKEYQPTSWVSFLEAASLLKASMAQILLRKKINNFLIACTQINDLPCIKLLAQLNKLPKEEADALKECMNFEQTVKELYQRPYIQEKLLIKVRSPRTMIINSTLSNSGISTATAARRNNRTILTVANHTDQTIVSQFYSPTPESCKRLSPTKQFLVTQSTKNLHVWNTTEKKEVATFPLSNVLDFSDNDIFFAMYDNKKKNIHLYSTLSKHMHIIKDKSEMARKKKNCSSIKFSPNGSCLLKIYTTSNSSYIDLFNHKKKESVFSSEVNHDAIRKGFGCDFSHDGNFLAYIAPSSQAYVFPINLKGPLIEAAKKCSLLKFLPNHNQCLLVASKKQLSCINVISRSTDRSLKTLYPITSFIVSPNNLWIAFTTFCKQYKTTPHIVELYNLSDQKVTVPSHEFYNPIECLQFNATSTILSCKDSISKQNYLWYLKPSPNELKKALDDSSPTHAFLLIQLLRNLKNTKNFSSIELPHYLQDSIATLPKPFSDFFCASKLSI